MHLGCVLLPCRSCGAIEFDKIFPADALFLWEDSLRGLDAFSTSLFRSRSAATSALTSDKIFPADEVLLRGDDAVEVSDISEVLRIGMERNKRPSGSVFI